METKEAKECTVGEMVVEQPGRARVFERFGIDYCCGGKIPLTEACTALGIERDAVMEALENYQADASDSDKDWSQESMTSLVDHIVTTHHAYLREEFPRLTKMTERVAEVHRERHAELPEVRDVFAALRNELEQHMQKEETILFPMIKQLDAGVQGAAGHCGGIANPICMMEQEHDGAGDALSTLRKLTGGFAPPDDACNTYRVMLDTLANLEADLHQHIHKENNILFPKALAAEHHAA